MPDIDAVTRAHEGLTAALQDFSQRLYAAAQQQAAADGAAPDPGAASAPDDDEVAEAEIVDEPDEQQSA